MASNGPEKPRFAVVTDSTADLTPELALRHGIGVVPITLTIDDEVLADGVLTQRELFERMHHASKPPTTSQPSVGALMAEYERALETADSVIAVHISSKLSGTVEAAHIAAQQLEGKVHVFDSRNLSWGLGWQVFDAAEAAREGLGVSDALDRIARARDEVKIVVSLDSLENLRRSGRIGAVSSYLGSLLNLKVTIAVDAEGAFAPIRGSRGHKAALRAVLDWVGKQMGSGPAGRFAVGHALCADKAQLLAEAIQERWDVTELVMYEAGSAITTHAGTIWGVAFWPGESVRRS